MKYTLFLAASLLFVVHLSAQNVGVNTPAPVENLQVDSCIKVGKNATLTGTKKNIIKFGDDAFVTIGEEMGDDKMYLRYGTLSLMRSDNSIGNGFMGIQTEAPTNTLDINGSLRLRGNGAAAGRSLTSDANGVAAWSGPIAFAAKRTGSSLTVNPLSVASVVFNALDYETNTGSFSTGISRFTAPVTGIYHFSGSISVSSTGLDNSWRIFFSGPNGSRNFDLERGPAEGSSITFAFNYRLNAGEYISTFFVNQSNDPAVIALSGEDTFFTGHLVR